MEPKQPWLAAEMGGAGAERPARIIAEHEPVSIPSNNLEPPSSNTLPCFSTFEQFDAKGGAANTREFQYGAGALISYASMALHAENTSRWWAHPHLSTSKFPSSSSTPADASLSFSRVLPHFLQAGSRPPSSTSLPRHTDQDIISLCGHFAVFHKDCSDGLLVSSLPCEATVNALHQRLSDQWRCGSSARPALTDH